MDRVKRISMQILDKYRDLLTDDFDKNKAILSQVATIRSKQLRNKIAGYITDFIKKSEIPKEELEEK
ncbi:MAG: 30S ribosomal protein S17e [archaeon]|nr:30S ribosomal protein S17e [archaeon]MCP8317143.1 30S ribosomal protein S17e [archaeon]MCP8321896.1 30S ribosomal protein S17e [archaeon]